MIIHNPILTGSFTVNGTDVSSITSSAASLTSLNDYTASQNNRNGTYATTGSNTFADIQTVNSNLVVTGSITAQTLVVQTVTSSVDYVTGSTRFGSLSSNTHVFTGSMSVSGSGTFVGNVTANGVTIGASDIRVSNGVLTLGGTSEVIRITSGSDVGIGTNTPTAKLHTEVNSSTWTAKIINTNTSTNNAGLLIKAGVNSGNEILLVQKANGSSLFLVDAGGNIGMGTTTTPVSQLELSSSNPKITLTATNYAGSYRTVLGARSGAEGVLQLGNNSDNFIVGGNSGAGGNLKFYVNASSDFITSTNGTLAMVISSGGNVGINNSSPTVKLNVNGISQFGSPTLQTSGTEYIVLGQNSSTGPDDGNCLGLYVTHAVASAGPSVKLTYQFRQNDNSGANLYGDAIRVTKEEGSNTTFTTFYTNPTIGVGVERMRLLSNGEIDFKSYGPNLNLRFNIQGGDTFNTKNGGSGTPMYLNYSGNGAIYAGAGAAVTLYAGSDERIKENINVVESTLDKVLQLIPKTFNYKETRNNNLYYGFIAQDVETIFPELVKTAEGISMCNDEEIENQKSIESFGLVWASILTKAIQELKAEINELKNN
jgi:hypothetical protein